MLEQPPVTWRVLFPGAANAIMTMPRYVNVVRSDSGASAAAEQAEEGSTPSQSISSSAGLVERQPSGKGIEGLWQLMTAHECGQCQLWDIGRGALEPIAVLGSPTFPARSHPISGSQPVHLQVAGTFCLLPAVIFSGGGGKMFPLHDTCFSIPMRHWRDTVV